MCTHTQRTPVVAVVAIVVLACGLGLIGPSQAGADDSIFIQATSPRSFDATVGALKRAAGSNGMMIMGHVNQASALSMTGLHLPGAESFLVGNPTVGKEFFSENAAVGAVLPLRIYIWQTDGATHVGYFKPSALLAAVDAKLAKPGEKMDEKFRSILNDTVK